MYIKIKIKFCLQILWENSVSTLFRKEVINIIKNKIVIFLFMFKINNVFVSVNVNLLILIKYKTFCVAQKFYKLSLWFLSLKIFFI